MSTLPTKKKGDKMIQTLYEQLVNTVAYNKITESILFFYPIGIYAYIYKNDAGEIQRIILSKG